MTTDRLKCKIGQAELDVEGVGQKVREALESQTVRHLRKSGCELLLAFRSSLDGVIHALDPDRARKKSEGVEEKAE